MKLLLAAATVAFVTSAATLAATASPSDQAPQQGAAIGSLYADNTNPAMRHDDRMAWRDSSAAGYGTRHSRWMNSDNIDPDNSRINTPPDAETDNHTASNQPPALLPPAEILAPLTAAWMSGPKPGTGVPGFAASAEPADRWGDNAAGRQQAGNSQGPVRRHP